MLLKEDSMSEGKIIEELDTDQILASHHLKRMLNCGIAEKERDGKKIIYSIALDSTNELTENAIDVCGRSVLINNE